ncbi:MAG: ABC transporter ATP-binding protein [Lachnospiraceae bacterium]|nr:ABC transporter ATP-binding protein [Lachnospiraceae bacterium]
MERNTKIRLTHVSKKFANRKNGPRLVLEDINLEVGENEFLVLLGAGQVGKTVLLDLIAGLDTDYQGEISFVDRERKISDMGIVFQRYALFPWKTVLENVEMNQKFRGMEKKERLEKAKAYLKLVGLEGFENHYPHQISGGMKQRTAIARAFAGESDILLLDEPFGALDAQTRYQMEEELLRIWQEEKRTVIFVTNNIEEAIFLGDRILLLEGSPARIKKEYIPQLERPRSYTDQGFLKLRNTIANDFTLVL